MMDDSADGLFGQTERNDEPSQNLDVKGPAITRRTVIGGLAALASTPAFANDEGEIHLAWNADRTSLQLRLDSAPEWSLARAAFADDAVIQPHLSSDKLHIRISPVRFASVKPFTLDLHFERRQIGGRLRWLFIFKMGLLPGQSAPILLSDFLVVERGAVASYLLGEAAPSANSLPHMSLSKADAQAMLGRLVGNSIVGCEGPAKLSFLPNLSWFFHRGVADTKTPLVVLPAAQISAASVRFGRSAPGRGPCWHRADNVPAFEADSFVMAFHGVTSRKLPIVVGKRNSKSWAELTLDEDIAAAFERWPLPKPGDEQPPGRREQVLLVAGKGQFDVHQGQGKQKHLDGPFHLDRGEIWWSRRGEAAWDVASELPVSSQIKPLETSLGMIELRGGDIDPINLSAKTGKFELQGQVAVTHIPRQVAGSDFSQLILEGGVVNLHLPDATKKRPHNLILGRASSARIPLDTASLAFSRSRDLLALTCRFKSLDLVLDAKTSSIQLPMPEASPAGGTPPAEHLLVVDLPPQHVSEEAIYRVLPDGVKADQVILPNVLVDGTALDDKLKPRKLSADQHAKELAKMIEEAKRKDPDYDEFITIYEKHYRDDSPPLPQREPGDLIVRSVAEKALKEIQSNPDNCLPLMTRAHLSGPTRIAFQVPEGVAWSAKLEIVSLTDFTKLDLKVVRRAMRFDPPERPDGENPLTLAKELDHFGIKQFTAGTTDVERWNARMENIRALMSEPNSFETSIELPTRVMLSPDNKAKWRTPRARNLNDLPYGHVPLWRMRLDQPGDNGPHVRAIWSPDFMPETFSSTRVVRNRVPVTKPAFRTAMDAYDRHEIVALSSVHGLPVLPRLKDNRTLDGGQFAPPSQYLIKSGAADPKDKDAIYRPRPLAISELTLTAMGGSITMDSGFEPPTGLGENLVGWPQLTFTVERWRQQTVLGRDVVVEIVYKGFLFPIGHRCTLVKLTERKFLRNPVSRHTTAYLVQRMFLRIGLPTKAFPAKYQPDDARRWPLRKVDVLTRWTPDIVDPNDDIDALASDGPGPHGRIAAFRAAGNAAAPAQKFQGLVFWPRTGPGKGKEVTFKLELEGSASAIEVPLIFVDNRAAHDPATMAALCDYYQGLSSEDPKDQRPDQRLVQVSHGGVERRYAEEETRGTTAYETQDWILGAEGRAPKLESVANNLFEMDALMEGADQPPFYPYIRRANVRIKQLERLSGGAAHSVWTKYIEDYRLRGFNAKPIGAGAAAVAAPPATPRAGDNHVEVFLELMESATLSFAYSGDRSGGIAKPDVPIVALSRAKGPVGAGTPKSTAINFANFDTFDPASFFPDAKLLGIVKFSELLKATSIVNGTTRPFPEIKQLVDYAVSALPDDSLKAFVSGLDEIEVWTNLAGGKWKPIEESFTLAATKIGSGNEKLTIADLLPGFARSLTDVHEALPEFIKKKQAGTTTLGDAQKALAELELGKLYQAGQRLLAEIDLIADDPIAPLKEAGRRLLEDLRGTVMEALSTGIGPQVRSAYDAAKSIDTEVERLFFKWFAQAEGRRWRQAVLLLPDEPRQWPTDGVASLATRFLTCFAGEVGITGDISTFTSEQWDKAIALFIDRPRFQQVARHCFGKIEQELRAYIREQNITPASQVKWLADRFQRLASYYKVPPVYDDYVAFVGKVYRLEQRIATMLKSDPTKLADEFARELTEFLAVYKTAAVQQARLISDDELRQTCSKVARLVIAFAVATTPEPPEGSLTCVLDPAQNLTLGTSQRSPLVNACADLRDLLGAAVRLISSFDSIEPALSSNSVSAPQRDRLKTVLTERKNALLAVMQSLITSAAATARSINQVLDAWRVFVGSLTPEQANDFQAWVEGRATDVCNDPTTLQLNIEQARTLTLAIGASIAQTGTTLSESLAALKAAGDGWKIEQFTDQTIKAAVEAARVQLSIQVADISTRLLILLVQQTSAFEAAAQNQSDRFRRAAKATFSSYVDTAIAELEAFGPVVKAETDKLRKTINDWQNDRTIVALRSTIVGMIGQVDQARVELQRASAASAPAERLEHYVLAGGHIARTIGLEPQISERLNDIETLRTTTEQSLQEQLYSIINVRNVLERDMITVLASALNPMLDLAHGAYATVEKRRTEVESSLAEKKFIALLFKNGIHGILHVEEDAAGHDRIEKDRLVIAKLRDHAERGILSVADVDTLIGIFNTDDSSIVRLFNEIARSVETVLRLDLGRFIDFAAIRKIVESEIKALVPSKASLSYDYGTKFEPQGAMRDLFDLWDGPKAMPGKQKFSDMVGVANKDNNFVLRARSKIDLKTGDKSALIEGYLQPFQVKLFTKAFDVVTLNFDGASFKSVNGGKPSFQVNLVDTELGSEVEFLKDLQKWLNGGGGDGFFLKFTTSPTFGLEAGYRFGLPIISIGNVSFSNIGLEASVMLPFEDKDAVFHIALSSRDNPFLISAAPYGGGGHVGLYANARKIVGVEASFEYGGVAAFAFGPLTGIGRITTGIFLSKSETRGASIQGHFFAGGSARIWIFGISTSLTVRMGQANGGSMCGSAVYAYSFSYGIDDIEFKVPVWRQEGKGFSGEGSRADLDDDLGGTQFAQASAQAVVDADSRGGSAAMPPIKPPEDAPDAEQRAWQTQWSAWKSDNREEIRSECRPDERDDEEVAWRVWRAQWEDWRVVSRRKIQLKQRARRDQAEVRLKEVTKYGVKLTTKVASRDQQWRAYLAYFDSSLLPEE